MVARQKDVKSFYTKLKKRYPDDPAVLSRDRKILEHVVFAIFLENSTFQQARAAFIELQRYFIDWNEIRIAKADEIARVVNSLKASEQPSDEALRVGERLRRLLQWIFDKIYKFELEDQRASGAAALTSFLDDVPYCTSFMKKYVALFGFGEPVVPLDENSMRVLRLLGNVVLADGKETTPLLDNAFKEADARGFFFALHELGCELKNSSTRDEAMEFLVGFDSAVRNRSAEPLVKSEVPTDPAEIARMYSRQERRAKNSMPTGGSMIGDFDDDSDDKQDDYPFEPSYNGDSDAEGTASKGAYSSGASEEVSLTSSNVSYGSKKAGASKAKSAVTVKTKRVAEKQKSRDAAPSDEDVSAASEKVSHKKITTAKKSASADSGPETASSVTRGKGASHIREAAEPELKEEPLFETTAKEKQAPSKRTRASVVGKAAGSQKKAASPAQECEVPAVEQETKEVPAEKTSVKKSKRVIKTEDKEQKVSKETVKEGSVKKTKEPKTASKKSASPDESAKDASEKSVKSTKSVAVKSPKSKTADVKTPIKTGVKLGARARKISSEPPDSTNDDVGKKTTKSSSKTGKGRQKS